MKPGQEKLLTASRPQTPDCSKCHVSCQCKEQSAADPARNSLGPLGEMLAMTKLDYLDADRLDHGALAGVQSLS
jgi:hypothetical protein